MTDKKQEAKQSGFLGIFKRKEFGSIPTHATSNGKPGPTAAPTRRAYKPRYAERDMVLSMPVEQRPDLVAKANEARLQGVCSDIGFSPTASVCSVSSHSRNGSQNWTFGQMPTHPNMHLKLQRLSSIHTAGASASSLQGSLPYGSGVYRTASSPASARGECTNAAHAEQSSRALRQYRPSPRPYHSVAAIPQSNGTSIEAVNQAYAELGISGTDFEPERASQMPTENPHAAHAAPVSHRLTMEYTSTRQRQYFGHNEDLPDLRADKGKGKQGAPPRAAAPSSIAGSSDYGEASDQHSGDRESYVLRTAAAPTYAPRAAPAYSDRTREPCTHDLESSSSSFAGSFENRSGNDFWSRADSDRNPSTSTLMTSYTELSEAAPHTARGRTPESASLRGDAGVERSRSADGLKQSHADREDADVDLEYVDEAAETETGESVELQDEAEQKVQSLPGAW